MDAIRERALRRELAFARATRPEDVELIMRELGEASGERTNRGGATADRAAAKPRKPRAKQSEDA